MSMETQAWLDNNVLVGFTKKRGNAWHWRQGTDNHFDDAIPIDVVRRRLFDWEPVKEPTLIHSRNGELQLSGEHVYTRSDSGEILCATTDTHKAHGYSEWLIQNVANVLDDTVQIGSAGLLKGGNIAWVQIEMPESYVIDGVEYRPTILGSTSINGSMASGYKLANTIVICDNTLTGALQEHGPVYKVRHTKDSKFVVLDAREKIGITLEKQADAFGAELHSMISQDVSDKAFESFLDIVNPIPVGEGTTAGEKRAKTMAEAKRTKFEDMWSTDPRVCTWKNTVWGVVQLMNTYQTHERMFKGNAVESTLMSTITGDSFKKDADTMATVKKVLQLV
jgi:phage/plasmid-like protein (TIGR03299 family)